MRILAWPAVSSNPYIADLYARVEAHDPELEIQNFRVSKAWRSSADLIHVHWPEAAVESPSTIRALVKTIVVLTTLVSHKVRGAAIVWTCHNLHSHDRRHPRFERVLRPLFERMVDGVIHLSEDSRTSLTGLGRLVDVPSRVVPHGYSPPALDDLPDKRTARIDMGLDPDLPVLAFVGMIRPYKNVPALITAFDQMNTDAQLVVAGRPADDEIDAEVQRSAVGVDRLMLQIRWLSDEEVTTAVRASDVVVLAYRDVHNSSVAVLAAGMGRPVVVNPTGSMVGFATSVGEQWVYPLSSALSGPALDEIVDWACKERSVEPSMADFDPDIAAARTAAFYRELVEG